MSKHQYKSYQKKMSPPFKQTTRCLSSLKPRAPNAYLRKSLTWLVQPFWTVLKSFWFPMAYTTTDILPLYLQLQLQSRALRNWHFILNHMQSTFAEMEPPAWQSRGAGHAAALSVWISTGRESPAEGGFWNKQDKMFSGGAEGLTSLINYIWDKSALFN